MKKQKSGALFKRVINKYINNKNYRKAKDHYHYAGECRGAAYSICNMKYNIPKKIPVVFHN